MFQRERQLSLAFHDFAREVAVDGDEVLVCDPEYQEHRRHLLFVYGTMKRGERNHSRIRTAARFIRPTRTRERSFDLLSKAQPYTAPVAIAGGAWSVAGELYEVSGPLLERVDLCEGHPMTYERRRVMVEDVNVPVWMYVYVRPSRGRISLTTNGIVVHSENRLKAFSNRG